MCGYGEDIVSFLRFLEDDVRELARKLESSGEDMRTASRSLADTDAGRIGTPALSGRCEEFADSWDYGFGQLSELARGIGDVANNAADTFNVTDEDLERALREGGGAA